MLDIPNILLVLTALFDTALVVFVYSRNRGSKSNYFFALFAIFLAFWSLALVGYSLVEDEYVALYFMKASYIAAMLIAVSFYFFSIYFAGRKTPSTIHSAAAVSLALSFIVPLLLLENFLTLRVVEHDWGKETLLSHAEYIYFASVFVYFFVGALVRLWIRYFNETDHVKKVQLLAIAASVSFAGTLGIYFNLLLPSPFIQDFRYIWSGPLFTFAIAVTITYSIFRFKLFNVKTIAAEIFTFALCAFMFVRTLLADTTADQVINAILLAATICIGVLLIRSVQDEVWARETIQKQAKDLEAANRQQESLLHFMSHEIKGYLTKSEAVFAATHAGDFGEISPKLKEISGLALADVRKGVSTVIDILDASNLKRGTVSYKKAPFDLVRAIEEIIADLEPAAQEKKLELIFEKPVTGAYTIIGDEEKLRRHVIRNLVDNSIKYTLRGHVRISLSRTSALVRMIVSDTGVGITPEDMSRLFTEGGKGEESLKYNVHSTGYGLYIAKQIVEGHGGKIWAESDGKDKGSRFIVELPIDS